MDQHNGHEAGGLNSGRRTFLGLAGQAVAVSLLLAAWLVPVVDAADPCCSVISVEPSRGLVTGFERSSGNIFTFRVKDKAVLSGIKPCQGFDAKLDGVTAGKGFTPDLAAVNRAKANPATPCCDMASAPGAAGRVLGVQPHGKFEGVEILLLELKRGGGDLVTATCLYCNGGTTRVDLASDLRARESGAKLLDTANKTESRIEKSGGRALVSDHGPGLKLNPNQAARTWMKFTAPAGDTATLIVPGASEPFSNVPIAK